MRPANLLPDRDGLEILALAGANLRLFGADGKLLEECGSELAFTDLLVDGDTLWLGSVPFGTAAKLPNHRLDIQQNQPIGRLALF